VKVNTSVKLFLATVAALGGSWSALGQEHAPAPKPDYIMQVRLAALASFPVRPTSWEGGLSAAAPGSGFTGAVCGNVYEGYTSVIPDGTPVYGQVVRVDERGPNGEPVELVLELVWVSALGSDGESGMVSVMTQPLRVRVTASDIAERSVFWFQTSMPLSVGLPVVDGTLQGQP